MIPEATFMPSMPGMTTSVMRGKEADGLRALEDEIAVLQTVSCNAQEICDRFAEFVRVFPELSEEGERKLLADSLFAKVTIKPIFYNAKNEVLAL